MTTPVTPVAPSPGTPPPGAPHEVTQPLDATARSVPVADRGNEKMLAPLTYAESPGAPVPIQPGAMVPAVAVRPAVPEAPMAPVDPAVPPVVPAVPVEPERHQPAASHTESPARGMPVPARDPSLQPTGGWGPAPGAEYNPLDGSEIRELVLHLFEELAQTMATDLRFVRALTYPRLECRVTVDVITFPPEGAVRITKILPDPKGQQPREVALQHADECCFVVMAQRQELNATGDPIDPPDKVRDELQLPKPHLQVVGHGVARQLVDLPSGREHDVSGMPIPPEAPRTIVGGAG